MLETLEIFFAPEKEGAERNEFVFLFFLQKNKKTNSFRSKRFKKKTF
jgi:hypothetical protein